MLVSRIPPSPLFPSLSPSLSERFTQRWSHDPLPPSNWSVLVLQLELLVSTGINISGTLSLFFSFSRQMLGKTGREPIGQRHGGHFVSNRLGHVGLLQ